MCAAHAAAGLARPGFGGFVSCCRACVRGALSCVWGGVGLVRVGVRWGFSARGIMMMLSCAMRREGKKARVGKVKRRRPAIRPASTASSASSTASTCHDKCALGVEVVVLVYWTWESEARESKRH